MGGKSPGIPGFFYCLMSDIATKEPYEIIAGDTLQWKKSLSDYLPSAGWALKYSLRGPAEIDLTTTADGDDHKVDELAADTADWKTGDYWWAAYVEKGAERHQVGTGTFKITPNLATASGAYEGRSHAKKVLDAIEAVIEGTATKEQQSYTIAGRSLVRWPLQELLQLRNQYKDEYARERSAERVDRGEASGRKILTRFVRP